MRTYTAALPLPPFRANAMPVTGNPVLKAEPGVTRALSGGNFAFLLMSTLVGQAAGTMATMTLPAVAPAVAASYGVPSALIGYQISLLAAAMLFSLLFGANLSTRWGACRVHQVGLGLLVAGCAIAAAPHIVFFFL